MTKYSPLQRVQQEHGSKKTLAKKVIGILSAQEGEEQEAFEKRILTLSNQKLLRLWDAQQKLESDYGSRDDLVKKLVASKFPKGNDSYSTKLQSFSTPKLLDLARQASV